MALNITFDGFAYMGDDTLSNLNVAYQAYFYKVGSGSSPSKWNNKRIVENTGYWNINLGDGDWLTQDGNAASGDEIIIVFWSPAAADRMDSCSILEEWSCFRIVLDGRSTYSTNVQVMPNICPNLVWSLPATGLVGNNVYAVNNSNDTHSWDYFGNTMYQRNSWHTTLMSLNLVDNTDYDWGDSNQDNNLPGSANRSHVYTSPGDYEVEIVIEDSCGCTVTGTDNISITKNAPVPDIIMIPATPDPNEQVSFQYVGTDDNDAITNIAWTIEDSGTYGNTNTTAPNNARDAVVPHTEGTGTRWYETGQTPNSGAFTNPGNHLVSIVVEWWDGFAFNYINYSETFNQRLFTGPTISFTQVPPEATLSGVISFNNTSTNIDRVGTGWPDHFEYTWRWTEGTTVEQETDKPYSYVFQKSATTDSAQVQLCAQWSDGWDTHNECIEKDVIFATDVTVTPVDCYYELSIIGTSEDGSVTGYGWTVFSGSGEAGPWTEMWASPADMTQQGKKICFSTTGYYKIEGAVFGNALPTYDYEVLEVLETCPPAPDADIIAICPPDVQGREIESSKKMRAKEVKPSLRGRMAIQPSARIIHGPRRPFPGPTNI